MYTVNKVNFIVLVQKHFIGGFCWQLEIQNKVKSIHNVVDMLSGIIGDGRSAEERAGPEYHGAGSTENGSPVRRASLAAIEEEERQLMSNCTASPAYSYVHYDPELHWCRVCDVFPHSAKDYLTHLHSADHRQVTQDHQLVDTPWHKLPADQELPSTRGAPVKRLPIKGE